MKATQILLNNPNFKVTTDNDGEVISISGLVWDSTVPSKEGFNWDHRSSLPAFRKYAARHNRYSELEHLAGLRNVTDPKRLSVIDLQYVGAHLDELTIDLTDHRTTIWASLSFTGPVAEYYMQTLLSCPGAKLTGRYVHGSDDVGLDEADNLLLRGSNPKNRVITEVLGVDLCVYTTVAAPQTPYAPSHRVSFVSGVTEHESLYNLHTNHVCSKEDYPEVDTQSDYLIAKISELAFNKDLMANCPGPNVVVLAPTITTHVLLQKLQGKEGEKLCKEFVVTVAATLQSRTYIMFGKDDKFDTEDAISDKYLTYVMAGLSDILRPK